ncbi:hypothetical protein ACFLYS_02585, partial [Chloroflexota bacterium]
MHLPGDEKRTKTPEIHSLRSLLAALVLALCLIATGATPVAALDVDSYFSISFNIEYSRAYIYSNNTFNATITGRATCINELPLTISEAVVTGKVIARHQESGTEVTLNSSYTISINPFPNDIGATLESSKTVALKFPQGSSPGVYSVSGELIEARVRATLWFNVTSYLPSSQDMGLIHYMMPPPGGEEDDEQPFFGTTLTKNKIDNQGIITEDIIAPSVDDKCRVTLEAGLKALDKYGQPLSKISILELKDPPPPPENRHIIGLVYDIQPDGTTFDPPAILTISYEEIQLPPGMSEEKLVLATWDEVSGQWIELEDCIVDPLANTISAPISHFSAFSAMAHTAPASFEILELSVSPQEVYADEEVTVSATAVNSGDLEGSYEVVLMIDNEVEQSRQISLAGKTSQVVSFVVSRDSPSLYAVNINGLLGSFVVAE